MDECPFGDKFHKPIVKFQDKEFVCEEQLTKGVPPNNDDPRMQISNMKFVCTEFIESTFEPTFESTFEPV